MDAIFQTDSPIRTARWKYIYVHHSRTTSGNAMTLARSADGVGDHFVIGNGDGCIDGEIQIGQRWNKQLSALPPAGAKEIDKDRKSTRLNSSHSQISYAVFCLKKKKLS